MASGHGPPRINSVAGFQEVRDVEHIEALARTCLGGPYPWYGGGDQQRLVPTVEADCVHSPQG